MEITEEMVLEPTKIPQEIKDDWKRDYPDVRYVVIYFQHWHDKGHRLEERYGSPVYVPYDNGIVQSPCMDFFENEKNALERMKILPEISNKKYTDISLIKL